MEVLLTVIVVFVIETLFGYISHRALHQSYMGSFYKSHHTHHYKLYPPEDYTSDKYREAGKDNTLYFFLLFGSPLIIAPIVLFALHIIPLAVFISAMITLGVVGFLNDYLHDHFHLNKSWLKSFGWFRHLTEVHRLHHITPQKNFGIFMFWWDRLFGSYVEKE